jgi:hypothetical protein
MRAVVEPDSSSSDEERAFEAAGDQATLASRDRGVAREIAVALAVAVTAPLVVFRAMLVGGLAGIPGDMHDGRLNAYFLEHSWGWVSRQPLHRSLWGLPMFFPGGGNALAYSDAMVAFGPLYWPWRALGMPPDTSYQLWCMAAVGASALAGYLFLRRGVGLSRAASALGAWLATCSASRLHQISHSQLLPTFYLLAGLGGAIAWARGGSKPQRLAMAAMALAAFVLQLYAGFYQGFFLAMAVIALAVVTLAHAETRRVVTARLASDWPYLLGLGAVGALCLVPWLQHYRAAQVEFGRHWEEMVAMVPRPRSWLYVTPRALAYHWLRDTTFFRRLPMDFEHAVGLGFVTTVCVLSGAVAARQRLAVRLSCAAAILLVVATTMVRRHVFWHLLVDLLPPLSAARALVRVGLLLPVLAAIVLGCWLDASRGRRRILVLALVAACAGEQLATLELHDRDADRRWVAEMVRRVDPHARAFVATRSSDHGGAMPVHLDAMFAASATGVPTVNGASGNEPRGWYGLQWARVRNPAAAALFRGALDEWLRAGGVDPTTVQWIRLPPTYRDEPRAPGPRRRSGTASSRDRRAR